MYTHMLWRIVNGHWRKIHPLDSDKYACCVSRERILPIGVKPKGAK